MSRGAPEGPAATPVARRLEEVRGRIARAARRAGRDPARVTLVAVSKTHAAGAVAEAAAAGQLHFGENRVQEARDKIPLSPPGLVWHLVGHLQGNKARDAVLLFPWIHSLDSADLARELDRRAGAAGRSPRVLIQLNLSGEATKSGIPPGRLPDLARAVLGLPHLSLAGLMTIPPPGDDPEAARPYFRQLALLLGDLRSSLGEPGLDQLSMGMTHDLEAAVEEGATLVRVGTAIFGER
jgi:hypothetical protein